MPANSRWDLTRRLKGKYIHHQELATVLLNYHIGRFVLSSLCVGDSVRLVLGGVRAAGFSLQNEHHP